MAREYTSTECKLHGTKYCRMLNMLSCEACTMSREKFTDPQKMISDLDALAAMVPEEGLSDLFCTDECVLCMEEPNKKTCYAYLDIASKEPKSVKTNLLGMKVKQTVGSILPIQLSSCGYCRRSYLIVSNIASLFTVIGLIIAIVCMSVRPVREAFMAVAPWMPIAVFALLVGVSYIIGSIARKITKDKRGKKTCFSVMDIPKLNDMRENGWFELFVGKDGMSKPLFAKKARNYGVFTGDYRPMDETAEEQSGSES